MANIRQIAKEANVSPSTVSRVLNNDPTLSVTPKTRRRVERAAEALNYVKVDRKNNLIGIVTAVSSEQEIDSAYYRDIKRAIVEELENLKLKFDKTILLSADRDSLEIDEIRSWSGVMIIGSLTPDAITGIKKLNSNIVIVDDRYFDNDIDVVHSNLTSATVEVLELLAKNGAKAITFVGGQRILTDLEGNRTLSEREARLMAYQRWMRHNQLQKLEQAYLTGWSIEAGLEAAKEILKKPKRPDAILAANDSLAIGVLRGLHQGGIHAPGDIQIASFDDSEMAKFFVPSLTTVHIPAEQLGRVSAHVLNDRLNGWREVASDTALATKLIVRESTKKHHE
ncbi:LacI family DNA-binding transcriptional regulator [Lacticaseibacillus rhamnosus]|uniref:LacI family DNA-binding transcriptional regulator n=1 Tax=Lacticaseibacillus rhamnosus TaxID=47715 RepID=UPI0023E0E48E|nr:LacI family DNA-binding transcriptional regulator [Lacticaseibacillus rhamnosus]MDF3335689.1 LacI family DNA-binding transcriptional regulator [Lacticaseibacillus rhamnosus]